MKFFAKKKEASPQENKEARIKILGPGCRNCMNLENNTRQALEDLGLELSIGHVTDFAEIASYQIMSTPGLVLDNQVISSGRVLNKDQIKDLLKEKL